MKRLTHAVRTAGGRGKWFSSNAYSCLTLHLHERGLPRREIGEERYIEWAVHCVPALCDMPRCDDQIDQGLDCKCETHSTNGG
ncbi:hypothetical protein GA0061084_1737 [Arthrobacter sp. NIO-1057]|nr:hypothetical protein GA0061084_1737 [Arthrobacter sp. NIO-1057]